MPATDFALAAAGGSCLERRVKELRAERDRYRGALERVESHGSGVAVTIAREALVTGAAGGGTL